MQQLGANSQADIGDFVKLFAVTTVMIQSIISFLMQTALPTGQQFLLGGIYEVVKFSASAFIFGILFSSTRTHPQARLCDYPRFMINRWHILFIPSILWTTVYLVFLPQLQQHGHYHDLISFVWQFISGNAAPTPLVQRHDASIYYFNANFLEPSSLVYGATAPGNSYF